MERFCLENETQRAKLQESIINRIDYLDKETSRLAKSISTEIGNLSDREKSERIRQMNKDLQALKVLRNNFEAKSTYDLEYEYNGGRLRTEQEKRYHAEDNYFNSSYYKDKERLAEILKTISLFLGVTNWLWTGILASVLSGGLDTASVILGAIMGAFAMPVLIPVGVIIWVFIVPKIIDKCIFGDLPRRGDKVSSDKNRQRVATIGSAYQWGHMNDSYLKGWIKE